MRSMHPRLHDFANENLYIDDAPTSKWIAKMHLYCATTATTLKYNTHIVYTECYAHITRSHSQSYTYIYAEVNYEMPEEFNETLILLGKLVGSKSQPKTIHIDFASEAKTKQKFKKKK